MPILGFPAECCIVTRWMLFTSLVFVFNVVPDQWHVCTNLRSKKIWICHMHVYSMCIYVYMLIWRYIHTVYFVHFHMTNLIFNDKVFSPWFDIVHYSPLPQPGPAGTYHTQAVHGGESLSEEPFLIAGTPQDDACGSAAYIPPVTMPKIIIVKT